MPRFHKSALHICSLRLISLGTRSKEIFSIEDCPYSCLGSVVVAVEIPGQALNPRTVLFAGLEADASDPALLEMAAEPHSAGIEQAAAALKFANQGRGEWVASDQALES